MGYPQTDVAGDQLRNALQIIAGAREDLADLTGAIDVLLEEHDAPFTPEADTTLLAQALDAIDARITAALEAIGEKAP